MKLVFLLLLTGHFLGDYYFQTERVALKKERSRRTLMEHCLVYCIPFFLIAFLFRLDEGLLLTFALAVLVHGAIDAGKAFFISRRPDRKNLDPGEEGRVYILDQSLHWLTLLLLAYFFKEQAEGLLPFDFAGALLNELGISWYETLQWSLALILIFRPSNITFRKLFTIYKPQQEPEDQELTPAISGTRQEKLRAGGIIGVLEKFICLILLTGGEYMAIGLVLTAKSIARYDKISKSSTFAEYYLIGTLSSIILVLLIHSLVFGILGTDVR